MTWRVMQKALPNNESMGEGTGWVDGDWMNAKGFRQERGRNQRCLVGRWVCRLLSSGAASCLSQHGLSPAWVMRHTSCVPLGLPRTSCRVFCRSAAHDAGASSGGGCIVHTCHRLHRSGALCLFAWLCSMGTAAVAL